MPSSVFFQFKDAATATGALRKLQLLETNITQFRGVLGAGPDPRANPVYLEIFIGDYYDGNAIAGIFQFLEVDYLNVCDRGKVISQYRLSQSELTPVIDISTRELVA